MIVQPGSMFYDIEKNEYEVLDFLGNGSFGDVYKVKCLSDNDFYALKTLATPFVDETILKSFANEGKLAQEIRHPNVVQYFYFHDGLVHKDLPMYIIMEYAEGGTLEKRIKDKVKESTFFANEELTNIISQLIDGMEAINNKLIHRDIKPDNILIHKNKIKISDFGLSKIVSQATRTSTFKGIGCLPFLAPEGWKLDKNTIQMDIYSMGIVFYELASLSFPYKVKKGDFEEWQNAHLFQNPVSVAKINSSLSPVISRLIMRMLEKDLRQRPQNWKEVRSYLEIENLPKTENSELIDKVLIKRNEQLEITTQQRLKREKREKEIEEFKEIVRFQYHKDIITPLKEFVEEINAKSDGPKITCHFNSNSFLNSVEYSFNKIKIDLKPIVDEDFYRDVKINDYGSPFIRRELRVPKIDKRRILAWGCLKASDNRGFNLILLQNADSIYGDWLLLFNRHNAIAVGKDNRPEPFPFEMNELEEEINYLNAMQIYVTDRYPLGFNKIKEFLIEYF
jgi:serine/threonine protein kinase